MRVGRTGSGDFTGRHTFCQHRCGGGGVQQGGVVARILREIVHVGVGPAALGAPVELGQVHITEQRLKLGIAAAAVLEHLHSLAQEVPHVQ